MPKKKNQETQKEQSERFNQTVADLEAAGELNPIEAADFMDKMLKAGARNKPESNDHSNLD